MVRASVRSLTATTSTTRPGPARPARKFRPMRPKPLIPTRTVICVSPRRPPLPLPCPGPVLVPAHGRAGPRPLYPTRPARADASLTGSWANPLALASGPSTTGTPSRPRAMAVESATTTSTSIPWARPGRRRGRPRRIPRSPPVGAAGWPRRRSGRTTPDALGDPGNGHGGQDAREQRSRSHHDLVGAGQGLQGRHRGHGVGRDDRDLLDLGGVHDGRLALDVAPVRGRLQNHRLGGGGDDPALRFEQPGRLVQAAWTSPARPSGRR